MEHTHIIQASDLDAYANRRDSQGVIPELVYWLVKQSVSNISVCRIPYGDAVNQPGLDGLVETDEFFLEFVPDGISYWEIGTGNNPQVKATKDFGKRTKDTPDDQRAESTFVFVTPRSSGADGWDEPTQTRWLRRRQENGWKKIRIIDGVKLADWLREFPAIGQWMAKKIGLSPSLGGLSTPAEHWETIQAQVDQSDPPLPVQIFVAGRDNACAALQALFEGKSQRLFLFAESPKDVEDFVAGYIKSLDSETERAFCNRCLFISEEDAWRSIVTTRQSHVLVADPKLGLDSESADLQTLATRNGHSVIIPLCGAWSGDNPEVIKLRSPSQSTLEKILSESGYSPVRARELASVGANRLSALRRHLLGLGAVPVYGSWENARLLSQAGMIGKWDGNNQTDKEAITALLGKEYGGWIELIRSDALRSDTPLIQKNEKWRMVARGEAWNALGNRLSDDDLNQFQQLACRVLGEYDPKFDLPKEERYAASIHGKLLTHSTNLREGVAETLALLGSRPKALSSCSQGKAETTALLTVRHLLKDADWGRWVSLEHLLPLLAEAAPDEFLDSVESSLERVEDSPFHQVFAQEGSAGVGGWNYISGLLWALETLAWHPDYLTRVTLILGELASIDPGGNWSNRPANSLADIFLPWHLQTSASIDKRKVAIQTLLQEQPEIGWNLLIALLPHSHGVTSGCHRPAWRNLISIDWNDNITDQEYWDQTSIYTDMAVGLAKSSVGKLCVLIEHMPDLPKPAFDNILLHLKSDDVISLSEYDRMALWEALSDLVRKYRKFSHTEWAIPSEILDKVDEAVNVLSPQKAELRFHHLFSDRDFDLYDDNEDYEEQRKLLDKRRQNALQEILDSGGVESAMEFANNVSSPHQVGHALGNITIESVEVDILPKLLASADEVQKILIRSYVSAKFWKEGWPWADYILSDDWNASQKSSFLVLLPFDPEVWSRAEKHLGSEEKQYWINADVYPWGTDFDYTTAIEKLISHGRAFAAIRCLGRSGAKDDTINVGLAERALLAVLSSEHLSADFDREATIEVITKLQNSPSANSDILFKIEWNFLPLLDQFSRGVPKTLEDRLASNPTFFCEVLSYAFRSKNDEDNDEEPTEEQRDLAKNSYKLLSEWKTIPGQHVDAPFDDSAFSSWLTEVKRITTGSGHLEVALSMFGQVLTYAPKDEGGLWIHKAVAQALNEKWADRMRNGFTTALFNQRGAHGFSSGKAERELARVNNEKAEALEANGFVRFATSMREFANRYERDAEKESQRDPFED